VETVPGEQVFENSAFAPQEPIEIRLEFHPEAELELIEAGLYYELEVSGLGARFETEVKQATELLLEQPELGHASTGDLRQLV